MLTIEVILPTKGRSNTSLPGFLNSAKATASNIERVFMTAVVNANDIETRKYLARRPNVDIIIEDLKKVHLAQLMNTGYAMSRNKGDAVCYIGDDFTFETKGWDDIVEENILKSNGWGLVSGPDGYLGNPGCPTFFFATRKMIDAAGDEFVCSRYGREGTDKIWGAIVGPPLNIMMWDERLKMEHHHASRTGVYDETFNALSKADIPGYGGGAYWAYIQRAQRRIVKAVKGIKNETLNSDMPPEGPETAA